MRAITIHQSNDLNKAIAITALGEPGKGGAPLHYRLELAATNPADVARVLDLVFQDGNPADTKNGWTQESLAAVIIDRLTEFQKGPFACAENGAALQAFEHGLALLNARTQNRLARGVEGKATA